MNDHINPDHHKQGGFETIDILKDKLSKEAFEGFCIGNIVKYLLRSGHKPNEPADRDFKKAAWYANMLAGNDPRRLLSDDAIARATASIGKMQTNMLPIRVEKPEEGMEVILRAANDRIIHYRKFKDGEWHNQPI